MPWPKTLNEMKEDEYQNNPRYHGQTFPEGTEFDARRKQNLILGALSLDRAIRWLQDSSAVIVDEDGVTYVGIADDDDDVPAITATFENADGHHYDHIFLYEENAEVEYGGGFLLFKERDMGDEKVKLQLLTHMDLPRYLFD